MSTKNLPLPGNSSGLTLDEITGVISSSAVIRAMQKVNMNYEPTDKEKLDEILNHPELLARAVALIINNKTDEEIGRVLGIKPFTVGFIRENEFVRVLCEECFNESMDKIKNGLSKIAQDSVGALGELVNPANDVADKTRYLAANAIINTIIKLNGEHNGSGKPSKQVNITQINNNIQPDAKEAYDRVMRDMESIIPVANNIYGGESDGTETSEQSGNS